jgi:hypothetical protein
MLKTYYVSEDIFGILSGGGVPINYFKNNGIKVPNENYINNLRLNFRKSLDGIFNSIRIYSEYQMRSGMEKFLDETSLPVISLDRIYLRNSTKIFGFLDTTRIDTNGNISQISRNKNNLDNEIFKLSEKLYARAGTNAPEIALVDDVVYSGKSIMEIIKKFRSNGISVPFVFSAINTPESKSRLQQNGVAIKSSYKIDNFIDQICERDFYFGLPQSGQFVKNQDGTIYKQPYFLPFGNPVKRASIPKNKAIAFSANCMERSIGLWSEIQNLSNRKIDISELPEQINNCQNGNIIDILKQKQTEIIK